MSRNQSTEFPRQVEGVTAHDDYEVLLVTHFKVDQQLAMPAIRCATIIKDYFLAYAVARNNALDGEMLKQAVDNVQNAFVGFATLLPRNEFYRSNYDAIQMLISQELTLLHTAEQNGQDFTVNTSVQLARWQVLYGMAALLPDGFNRANALAVELQELQAQQMSSLVCAVLEKMPEADRTSVINQVMGQS